MTTGVDLAEMRIWPDGAVYFRANVVWPGVLHFVIRHARDDEPCYLSVVIEAKELIATFYHAICDFAQSTAYDRALWEGRTVEGAVLFGRNVELADDAWQWAATMSLNDFAVELLALERCLHTAKDELDALRIKFQRAFGSTSPVADVIACLDLPANYDALLVEQREGLLRSRRHMIVIPLGGESFSEFKSAEIEAWLGKL